MAHAIEERIGFENGRNDEDNRKEAASYEARACSRFSLQWTSSKINQNC